jgi:hypothetical protein
MVVDALLEVTQRSGLTWPPRRTGAPEGVNK